MIKYLLDTNCFSQSCRLFYSREICPDFLPWILDKHREGSVFSIEAVKKEMVGGHDFLAPWCGDQGDEFFLKPDAGVMSAMGIIADWVMAKESLMPVARQTYLSDKADQYLVAHAKAHDFCLVTNEVPSPSARKVIKIPDVCDAHDVSWISFFDFMRGMSPGFVRS